MQRVLFLVLAGCGLLWLAQRQKAAEEVAVEEPSAEVAAAEAPPAPKVEEASWPTAPVSLRLPSNQVNESTPGMKSWFTPVKFRANAPERYGVPRAIPVEWDASCKGQPVAKTKEFSKLIQQRAGLGVHGLAQFPKTAYVARFHQFWKIGNEYFQLSATTDQGEPPTYTSEYYSYESADMTRNMRALPLPTTTPGQILDIDGVYELTKKLLKTAKEKGGVEAGRLVVYLVFSPGGDQPPREVQFLNEKPMQYHDNSLSCQLTASEKTARCECAAPETAEAGK